MRCTSVDLGVGKQARKGRILVKLREEVDGGQHYHQFGIIIRSVE